MATVEIVTTAERYRRWSLADRERILAECERPGAVIEHVAKRNDVCTSLVHKWRKERREIQASATLPTFVAYGSLEDLPVGADATRNCSSTTAAVAMAGNGFVDRSDDGNALEILAPNGFRILIRADTSDALLGRALRQLKAL